jgi:5-methylcytosine-specific restriction endonuclease McrA
MTCQCCKSLFKVYTRREFDGSRKRKFCSPNCAGKDNYTKNKHIISNFCFKKGHDPVLKKPKPPRKSPKLLFGKDNPAYTTGEDCGRRQKYYKHLAFDNLPHHCLLCKSVERLHVHHKDGTKNNHKLENLCILCNRCHQKLHRNARPELSEILKNPEFLSLLNILTTCQDHKSDPTH